MKGCRTAVDFLEWYRTENPKQARRVIENMTYAQAITTIDICKTFISQIEKIKNINYSTEIQKIYGKD